MARTVCVRTKRGKVACGTPVKQRRRSRRRKHRRSRRR